MRLFIPLLTLTGLSSCVWSAAVSGHQLCMPEQRAYHTAQFEIAYNQHRFEAFDVAFSKMPFGTPTLSGYCTTMMWITGGTGIVLGETGRDIVRWLNKTRQSFSSVTTKYQGFDAIGNTILNANMTLGVKTTDSTPITLSSQFFLHFSDDCRISDVRILTNVPPSVDKENIDINEILKLPE